MDTIYCMGTIVFVKNCDLPPGTTTIPTKLCTSASLEIKGKRSRRRVDSQFVVTFNTRHSTQRPQSQLKLVQFDIKDSFMVSSIHDKEIFIELPKGYEAPEGFTTRLNHSCYGTRDAAFRFWRTLSTWMVESGFEAVNADKTLFRMQKDNGTVMIVALYVDDWLTAHNNDVEYAKFITALAERFELSAESTEVTVEPLRSTHG
eukprot:398454-Rhodomonas_salina.1